MECRQRDRALVPAAQVGADALEVEEGRAFRAARGRAGLGREGGAACGDAGQSRTQGVERSGRFAVHRRAGHESGRVHVRPPPPGERAALRHGWQGRLHGGRWRAHDARRARFRAHTERHLARPRRRGRRHAVHLAGRSGHSADELARCEFLRGASTGGADTVDLSRENWTKPYSPVFLYKWDESYTR